MNSISIKLTKNHSRRFSRPSLLVRTLAALGMGAMAVVFWVIGLVEYFGYGFVRETMRTLTM
jgi:hypothetical protein